MVPFNFQETPQSQMLRDRKDQKKINTDFTRRPQEHCLTKTERWSPNQH